MQETTNSQDRYTKANLLKVRYRRAGTGPPLLLLHGWSQSLNFWQNITTELAQKFTVYSLDLPGFGLSDTPHHSWTNQEYAAFIEQFCAQIKINNPVVIGHSFGGKIALICATQIPMRKLVLYNTSISSQPTRISTITHFFIKTFKDILPQIPYISFSLLFHPPNYHNPIRVSRKRAPIMLQTYILHLQDLTNIAKMITTPTLIIVGNSDKVVSPLQSQRLHSLIKSSELVVLKNTSHSAHWQNPQLFLEQISTRL